MNWRRHIAHRGLLASVALLAFALSARSDVAPPVPEAALPPNQATTVAVDTIWEARPHWTQEGYGTLRAATSAAGQVRTFEVHAPGQCAIWWRPLDQPVDVASFPLVSLRLQAAGLSPDSQGYLVSLLLGEANGGAAKMRGVLSSDELLDGQPWEPHTVDLRTLGEFDAVLGIKVEVWAAPQGVMPASLSLLPLAFLADGERPAAEPPGTELPFIVRDRTGNPVSDCQVAIDYENLNARVFGTTDPAGLVTLQARVAGANHTACFRAAGFLPLELAEMDGANTTEVGLVPARQLKGILYLEGQPTPGVVQIDTKTPRPAIGRFPRLVFAAADREGRWEADVPAEAYVWLVRAGAHGGGTVDGEFTEVDRLVEWSSRLNLPTGNDTGTWTAPTAAWLLREGDNDAIAAMAGDCAESAAWRTKALSALASVALSDPDAGDYYLLDLARLAARADDPPYAGQAADSLLAILRRSGVQPIQAAEHLREKSGGSLPTQLSAWLGNQVTTWNQVVGKNEAEPPAALPAGTLPEGALPTKRVSDRPTVTLDSVWPSRRSQPATNTDDAAPTPPARAGGIDLFSPRGRQATPPTVSHANPPEAPASRSSGSISFQQSANRRSQTTATEIAMASPGSSGGGLALADGTRDATLVSVPVTATGSARSDAGGMVSITGTAPTTAMRASSSLLSPPPPDVFTVTLPALSRPTSASTAFAPSARHGQGEAIPIAAERSSTPRSAPWTFARANSPSVRIGAKSAESPGAVSMPGAADRVRDTLTLDFTSLADSRSAAVENAMVRNEWERIAAEVQAGDYPKARTDALALATRLTTQNAILAYLPLLALTDADPEKADRNAVSACLDVLGNGTPQTVGNAYAASLLHCYRRGDFDFAQELHTRYRAHFPDAKPSPAVLLALSLCHIKRGEQEQAHTHLATIVHDFPATDEAPRAALLLGWIDLSRQKYPEARATLEALVQAYPTNPCAAKAKQILLQIPQAAE